MKHLVFFALLFGFLTQVLHAKAEGLLLNSRTIPMLTNCMADISLTNKQKIGLVGLVVFVGAVSQTIYKIYQIAKKEQNELNQKTQNKSKQSDQMHTIVTQEQFEENKSHLSEPLQQFLTDFATWSKEEKKSIQFNEQEITIRGLSKERQAAYEGDVSIWLKARLNDMAWPCKDGIPLIPPYVNYPMFFNSLQICIDYLRQ